MLRMLLVALHFSAHTVANGASVTQTNAATTWMDTLRRNIEPNVESSKSTSVQAPKQGEWLGDFIRTSKSRTSDVPVGPASPRAAIRTNVQVNSSLTQRGDSNSTRFPCSNLLQREQGVWLSADSPCRRIEIHPVVPEAMATQVCAACLASPCLWDALTTLSPIDASVTPSGYLFDKAYVVHYSRRGFRRCRMVDRLRGIGLSTNDQGDSDNVAVLSDFDAEEISEEHRKCLPHNATNCVNMNIGEISLSLKHYAAYYDMLRKGYRFALVMEDDAMFESGSKMVEIKLGKGRKAPKRTVRHQFKIDRGFKHHNFRDIFRKEIVPNLPVAGKPLPPDFIHGLVPSGSFDETKKHKGRVHRRRHRRQRRDHARPYNVDFLMLAACDQLAMRMETMWRTGGTYAGGSWSVKRYGGNQRRHFLSAVHSCTRCMIAYVVSMQGAVKVLTNSRGFCRSVDYNVGVMSKEVPKNESFNCLHVFPNVVWEDPGPEGDGNFLQRNPTLKRLKRPDGPQIFSCRKYLRNSTGTDTSTSYLPSYLQRTRRPAANKWKVGNKHVYYFWCAILVRCVVAVGVMVCHLIGRACLCLTRL